jgi:hypothetical protein
VRELVWAPIVLFIATVHRNSPRWIEIQTSYLREHISVPFQTWSSIEGIDPSYAAHFDRIIDQRGRPFAKLNHLAIEISQEAHDDDLLMFLGGDAFPIADPMPTIADGLARAPLVAVRRAENNEPQPHPCFCVTTMGAWRALPGDWSTGPTWAGAEGERVTAAGANLLRRLELTGTPWVEVLRSNRRDLDPVYFGIYGDIVYHHGVGFTYDELDGGHRAWTLKPSRKSSQRRIQRHQLQQSKLIFEEIQRGGSAWLSDFA